MKNYSFTQFELFDQCNRKYEYVYKHNMLLTMHPAALLSGVVHDAMACWYKGVDVPWDEYWQRILDNPQKPVVWDDFYSLDLARQIYAQYTVQFASDKEEFKVIAVEESKVIPISYEHGVRVKPDVVLWEIAIGKRWVVDYKISKQSKTAVMFDRQLLGQMIGYEANGIIRVGIKIKPPTKKDPQTHVDIERTWIEPPPDIVTEWLLEAQVAGEQIEVCEETEVWPKKAPKACWDFNTPCPFLGVCEAGALRQGIIDMWPKLSRKESFLAAEVTK